MQHGDPAAATDKQQQPELVPGVLQPSPASSSPAEPPSSMKVTFSGCLLTLCASLHPAAPCSVTAPGKGASGSLRGLGGGLWGPSAKAEVCCCPVPAPRGPPPRPSQRGTPPRLLATAASAGWPQSPSSTRDVPLGLVGHERVGAQILQFAVVVADKGDVEGLRFLQPRGAFNSLPGGPLS